MALGLWRLDTWKSYRGLHNQKRVLGPMNYTIIAIRNPQTSIGISLGPYFIWAERCMPSRPKCAQPNPLGACEEQERGGQATSGGDRNP